MPAPEQADGNGYGDPADGKGQRTPHTNVLLRLATELPEVIPVRRRRALGTSIGSLRSRRPTLRRSS